MALSIVIENAAAVCALSWLPDSTAFVQMRLRRFSNRPMVSSDSIGNAVIELFSVEFDAASWVCDTNVEVCPDHEVPGWRFDDIHPEEW